MPVLRRALSVSAWRIDAEALLILGGSYESADHAVLLGDVAGRRRTHLVQPEDETVDVTVSS